MIRFTQYGSEDPLAFQSSVSTDHIHTARWRWYAAVRVSALYDPYGGRKMHVGSLTRDICSAVVSSICTPWSANDKVVMFGWSQVWLPSTSPKPASPRSVVERESDGLAGAGRHALRAVRGRRAVRQRRGRGGGHAVRLGYLRWVRGQYPVVVERPLLGGLSAVAGGRRWYRRGGRTRDGERCERQ